LHSRSIRRCRRRNAVGLEGRGEFVWVDEKHLNWTARLGQRGNLQHCRYSSERKEGQARYIFVIDNDAVGSRRQRAIDCQQAERFGKRQGRRLAPRSHRRKASVLLLRAILVADGFFESKGATVVDMMDFIAFAFATSWLPRRGRLAIFVSIPSAIPLCDELRPDADRPVAVEGSITRLKACNH
jgi:hypothetical protein